MIFPVALAAVTFRVSILLERYREADRRFHSAGMDKR
jgi:hypothetical protein